MNTRIVHVIACVWAALWLLALIFLGSKSPLELELNEIGDMLAGFVSPLALLYVIAGLRQSNIALEQNKESIDIQAAEFAKLVTISRESVAVQKKAVKAQTESAEIEKIRFSEEREPEFNVSLNRAATDKRLGNRCNWEIVFTLDYSGPKIENLSIALISLPEKIPAFQESYQNVRTGCVERHKFTINGSDLCSYALELIYSDPATTDNSPEQTLYYKLEPREVQQQGGWMPYSCTQV